MTDQAHPSTYKQGYSAATVSNHQRRTASSDAAFLLPHLKQTDRILDVGCGPGTITSGLARYTTQGSVIGIDVSAEVLAKARSLAADAGFPTAGPGAVTFEEGNVLATLPFPDDTFDVVFCSQVLGHMPSHELVVRALREMRRVAKPGGIVAAREAAAQHFWPGRLGLDRLWGRNMGRVLRGGSSSARDEDDGDSVGGSLPALFRRAGFVDDDSEDGVIGGGRVLVGAGTSLIVGREGRRWIARRAAGQLRPGDPFRQAWVDAGITEDEIQETVRAVEAWVETQDAWCALLQCEMLAWK